MKGDFTRLTFDPRKHFSRVLMQQGRVQIDADWNEQGSIILHYLRTLAADFIGPHGGSENAFKVVSGDATSGNFKLDFKLMPGHYYVNGTLCELEDSATVSIVSMKNEGNKVRVTSENYFADGVPFRTGEYVEMFAADKPTLVEFAQIQNVDDTTGRVLTLTFLDNKPHTIKNTLRRITTYRKQPDPPDYDADGLLETPSSPKKFLVYLDVWERHLTYLEDFYLREVALGANGPDTTTRSKVIWQVRIIGNTTGISVGMKDDEWDTFVSTVLHVEPHGMLRAQVKPEHATADTCIVSPDSCYRGLENQLYRVEIHSGGGVGKATFKWSRDNGSVLASWMDKNDGNRLMVVGIHDQAHGFAAHQWVELTSDALELQGKPGDLVKLAKVEQDVLTVDEKFAVDRTKYGSNPKVRRWDQKATDTLTLSDKDHALPIPGKDSPWIDLENGVQIHFADAKSVYRTGDYWLIPARVATGEIEWPLETKSNGELMTDHNGNPVPAPLPPHGIEHYYAPLGLIDVDSLGNVSFNIINDLRRKIKRVYL